MSYPEPSHIAPSEGYAGYGAARTTMSCAQPPGEGEVVSGAKPLAYGGSYGAVDQYQQGGYAHLGEGWFATENQKAQLQ